MTEKIIGIDLGTSNSAAAVIQGGKPTLIPAAEGTTAAEMKHGPIALIDDRIPVIALIPNDRLYEKTLGNIAELKARNATVIALTTEPSPLPSGHVNHILTIPNASEFITPILAAIPLQLLAYHIATNRGCNVDQPRNLAKTVTVE